MLLFCLWCNPLNDDNADQLCFFISNCLFWDDLGYFSNTILGLCSLMWTCEDEDRLCDWRASLQPFHVVWREREREKLPSRALSVFLTALSGQLVLHHLYLLFISLITHMIATWFCGYCGVLLPEDSSSLTPRFLKANQLVWRKAADSRGVWDCSLFDCLFAFRATSLFSGLSLTTVFQLID